MKKQDWLILIITLATGLVACNATSVSVSSSTPTVGSVIPTSTVPPIMMSSLTAVLSPTAMSFATPTPESPRPATSAPHLALTPITDFNAVGAVFESEELGLTVKYPLGWTAKQNLQSGTIAVVDDWIAFTSGDANADSIGLLILSLPKSPDPVGTTLDKLASRMKNITRQIGDIEVEERAGQDFAWGEYTATSLEDKPQVYYFLAAISNENRTALIFASVNTDRQEEVRPIFHAIVERIELH